MSVIRLSLILALCLLPALTACSIEERRAAGIAMQNYGSSRSTVVSCTTTHYKRSSTTSCY